ncbi:acyl-CoA/acyl-ACP dehydrogenase (plasmid) [Shinella sp. H4-D48]|uniref:acyl-CoA dehydrogenase family protein n=1 Tax=Shinella sp. H4-D48 TaxID=2925841 RepID=UPI001F532F77|nr:acyl-CoA dehydrogenase family protein [Shinella sp. H4-D48]UNK40937.1 acyl-CoA/acyl-ACP dehydrogenase [Shinella sp. H4-D48]
MSIDFTLSDEQKALRQNARAFAEAILSQVKATIAPFAQPEDRFYATKPFYQKMVDAGFLKALLPEAYGGTAMSTLDFALAAEELARIDVNVPSALLATGLGIIPIARFGTDEQKKRFLPDFAGSDAKLAALAFTEVTGGANFDCPDPRFGVQTFAIRDGDEYVINGEKHYTTNGTGWDGTTCHLYTVTCRTDPAKGPDESLAMIVVPGSAPGIEVVGFLDTLGHRATVSPRIRFNNVRVPVSNLLGAPGDGKRILEQTFAWTAALIGAASTGVMRAAFEIAYQFARTDCRSGPAPIIGYQNVGFMLADLKMRIEASRYLTWKACHRLDESDFEDVELAVTAKVYCSELAVQVVYDAMRLVGVDSYTQLHPLGELMQDALCFPLYDGGNMGARRRQLHEMFLKDDYDPLGSCGG